MFASLSSVECHLSILFKGRLTGIAEISLSGEEGVGTEHNCPQVSVLKNP